MNNKLFLAFALLISVVSLAGQSGARRPPTTYDEDDYDSPESSARQMELERKQDIYKLKQDETERRLQRQEVQIDNLRTQMIMMQNQYSQAYYPPPPPPPKKQSLLDKII